jgi:hypothetical protein
LLGGSLLDRSLLDGSLLGGSLLDRSLLDRSLLQHPVAHLLLGQAVLHVSRPALLTKNLLEGRLNLLEGMLSEDAGLLLTPGRLLLLLCPTVDDLVLHEALDGILLHTICEILLHETVQYICVSALSGWKNAEHPRRTTLPVDAALSKGEVPLPPNLRGCGNQSLQEISARMRRRLTESAELPVE